jgi:hypothetical protein
MECLPGGLCVFLGQTYISADMGAADELRYNIYHPQLGRQEMPDYYFISLDTARNLRYYIDRELGKDWDGYGDCI